MERIERTEDQIHRMLEDIRQGNPLTLRIKLFSAAVTVYSDDRKNFLTDSPRPKTPVDRNVLVRAIRLFIEESKPKGVS